MVFTQRSRSPQQRSRFAQFAYSCSLLCTATVLATSTIAAAQSSSQLELRVAIEEDVSEVTIGSSTDAVLRDGSGQVLAQIPAMGALVAESDSGRIKVNEWLASQAWIEPTDGGYVFIGEQWYRGRTLVVPTDEGLTAVNYVDLEHYLYSVVGGEMPTSWHIEALKAQAVSARTYALYQRQHRANSVFDVGDTTSWQVYSGIEDETQSTQIAVNETAGQVLTYDGQIIEAVFHSSSGGHTENVEEVWTSPRDYLRGVQDFDQTAPVYQWIENVTADRLEQLITGVGDILSIVPAETTQNGRISSLRVIGDEGEKVLSGDQFRQALNLRSTLFTVNPQYSDVASAGNVANEPESFLINGRGFGHGIGLSQWGAKFLAEQGYTYDQIVAHYYTGASLAQIEVE